MSLQSEPIADLEKKMRFTSFKQVELLPRWSRPHAFTTRVTRWHRVNQVAEKCSIAFSNVGLYTFAAQRQTKGAATNSVVIAVRSTKMKPAVQGHRSAII
jgi:hypothetical protein